MEKGILRKGHTAIHIKAKLSLFERRLFNALYENFQIFGNEKENKAEIRVSYASELMGKKTRNYEAIYKAILKLSSCLVRVGGIRETDFSGYEEGFSLISEYKVSNGIITYKIPQVLTEGDSKQYASLDKQSLKNIKSSYAMALYENCASYVNFGQTRWVSILELKDTLGISSKKKLRFCDVNKLYLKPAVNDVNRCTNIDVSFKVKKGVNDNSLVKFFISEKTEKKIKPSYTNSLKRSEVNKKTGPSETIETSSYSKELKEKESKTDDFLEMVCRSDADRVKFMNFLINNRNTSLSCKVTLEREIKYIKDKINSVAGIRELIKTYFSEIELSLRNNCK